MVSKLTPKQQLFVAEYLIDLNATQAAIRAGYSAKTAEQQGFQLLKKTTVSRAIQEAKDKRAKRNGIDQDVVLNRIIDTVERCRQAVPVVDQKGFPVFVELPDGKAAPAYTFDAGNALRGLDLLAKHVGLYELDNRQKTDPLSELAKAIQGSAIKPVTGKINSMKGKHHDI